MQQGEDKFEELVCGDYYRVVTVTRLKGINEDGY